MIFNQDGSAVEILEAYSDGHILVGFTDMYGEDYETTMDELWSPMGSDYIAEELAEAVFMG